MINFGIKEREKQILQNVNDNQKTIIQNGVKRILDKKNKLYGLNTDIIEQQIINVQIDNLSKFLSKFSLFISALVVKT